MSSSPHNARFLAPLAIATVVAVVFAHGALAVALPVVPLLLLVASLLFGHFPGCEAAMRLSERFVARSRRGRTARAAARRPRLQVPGAIQGGLLLAASMSGRSPPV